MGLSRRAAVNRHIVRRIIATPRLGRLRVSPHFYKTREEIDQLIEALPA
jgi:selenocysteine lyase/cysteine desulfurase